MQQTVNLRSGCQWRVPGQTGKYLKKSQCASGHIEISINTGKGKIMQAWDQVQVKKTDDKHYLRAGVVQSFDASTGVNVVALDETLSQEKETAEFADADLVLLGR